MDGRADQFPARRHGGGLAFLVGDSPDLRGPLAQAQALAGDIEAATATFERAVAAINDVGLLAEEVDPRNGEMIGNFPQAFSHIGLINAAWAITETRQRTGCQ